MDRRTAYERLKRYRSLRKRTITEGSSDLDDLNAQGNERSRSSLDSDDSENTSTAHENISGASSSEYIGPQPSEQYQGRNSPEISDELSNSNSEEAQQDAKSASSDVSESDNDSFYSYDSSTDNTSSGDEFDPAVAVNPIEDLKENLKLWSIKNSITLTALSQLLVLLQGWLQRHCPLLHNWLWKLPKDARTLLGTTVKKYDIRPMVSQSGKLGEFIYFGISDALECLVKEVFFPDHLIRLMINVDGIPLFKCSAIGFWVILCMIYHEDYDWKPFPVAVYSGPGKPGDVNDFLNDYVTDVTRLLSDGIILDGIHYKVGIRNYVCDTPARSFIKCTVGHGGFYCCERCTVKGVTVKKKRVYPERDCELRTEESFFDKDQEEHHTATSPLVRIPGFQPISMFVLDYMHLLCLGVMKRLLSHYWVAKGTKTANVSLLPRQIKVISDRLESLRNYIPAEFQRKPRGTADLSRYKATEYRFFLLYCGPVILKTVLPKHLYEHFLLLHCASRLLCTPEKAVIGVQCAEALFEKFFSTLPLYYGDDSQITNMHNLLHITDDVKHFQCSLDRMSAFPFENALGKMKKTLRSSAHPLAQYCRRKVENNVVDRPVKRIHTHPSLKKGRSGSKVLFKNFTLKKCRPDNFVIMADGRIVEITDFDENEEKEIIFTGRVWNARSDIFGYPYESSKLEEWEISEPEKTTSSWKVTEIKSKLLQFFLTSGGTTQSYAINLLHSTN